METLYEGLLTISVVVAERNHHHHHPAYRRSWNGKGLVYDRAWASWLRCNKAAPTRSSLLAGLEAGEARRRRERRRKRGQRS